MMNFVGHDEWKLELPQLHKSVLFPDDTEVIVLRGLLFFYAGQKTTLGNIRNNFTLLAIIKLEHDKFIEIKYGT